jgi:phosphoserine phosphatase
MGIKAYLAVFTIAHLIILSLALTVSANSDISEKSAADPLPSWNEGAAKTAILTFVANATNESHQDYVEPDERIATFDNDGTLWCEYPELVQSRFMFELVKDMAPEHPEWNDTEPFSSIISGTRFATNNFSAKEYMQIYVATSSNLTADEYMSLARNWLNSSMDPRSGLPYTSCVYRPMLELMSYLQAEGFKIYIVTGGDEDFVRAFSEEVYGVPPEQVIGSAFKLQFIANNSSSSVIRLPEILVIDDGVEKAKEIQQNIGLRPIFAYGNSDGDVPMLQFTTGGARQGIGLLNHHDDPVREYAYDNGTVGSLNRGLTMAGEWGWHIVSMKDDWKEIF